MKDKKRYWGILLGVLSVMFFAGGVRAKTSQSPYILPEQFSWYGESGALRAPVYDSVMPGLWWMPNNKPTEQEEQENTPWGNRGYVFVGTETPAPIVVSKPEKKVAEEKVEEKIVYRDRIIEKPVKKIVYVDRNVEKTKYIFLNLQDIYFYWNSSKLRSLNLKVLKKDAEILKANPNVNVVLLGSASPEGGTTYNQKLSQRRVNAVKNYLVNKEGISADRLKTEAEGAIQAPKKSWPFARKVRFIPVK
ncbi:MAG: OmpA family protein [Candidatus Omnitrophica bacterium]|nr:OmpA family protein [Candidatus Omnitrophota bacterium]